MVDGLGSIPTGSNILLLDFIYFLLILQNLQNVSLFTKSPKDFLRTRTELNSKGLIQMKSTENEFNKASENNDLEYFNMSMPGNLK